MTEWTGTLRFPMFAIGGETTGIELETDDGKFDLDLTGIYKQFKDKPVVVKGKLETRKGTERERRVIVVDEMEEVKK